MKPKILCTAFSNALYHIALGWKNAINNACEWKWWTPQKPAFDIFDEEQPDIFIGTTYNLDDATIKCIAERKDKITVILKGNNYGPINKEIDSNKYPIGMVTDKEIRSVEKLIRETGKPDLIFNFYHKNRMKDTMDYWTSNLGVQTIDMQPAADIITYYPTQSHPSLECDIAFVGGYWKYKAQNIDKYLLPLCYPVDKYNIKIFGNQPWPVPQYLGMLNDYTANTLFSSALICPNISEPHANVFGFEVNERPFKLAASKAFCISDYIASLVQDVFIKEEILVVDSPEEMHDLIHTIICNPNLREKHIEQAYNTVMCGHTYHHRIANLFDTLGRLDISEKIKYEYKKIINNRS